MGLLELFLYELRKTVAAKAVLAIIAMLIMMLFFDTQFFSVYRFAALCAPCTRPDLRVDVPESSVTLLMVADASVLVLG